MDLGGGASKAVRSTAGAMERGKGEIQGIGVNRSTAPSMNRSVVKL
jgi:hypothetical protein